MLRTEDDDVAKRFTDLLGRRVDLRLGATVESVRTTEDGRPQVTVDDGSGTHQTITAEVLLMATGRVPNGDTLDLTET
ncbi:hypothetical protein QOZ75_29700, partial [Pseudomonas aeruginosa]|uniref:hypothetical protein n=1 Tax=Pseudomonas aeruginosa TaxID=287 RepID=UPI00346984D4